MKKHFLTLMLLLSSITLAAQTLDTVWFDNARCPRYHYSSWYDTTACYFTTGRQRPGLSLETPSTSAAYPKAKEERFNQPTLLAGMAVLTIDGHNPNCCIDSVLTDTALGPDTCFLFTWDRSTNETQIVAMGRWDTAAPFIWKIPMNADTLSPHTGVDPAPLVHYLRVFEFTFPQPVPVDSTIWVASTNHNLETYRPPARGHLQASTLLCSRNLCRRCRPSINRTVLFFK